MSPAQDRHFERAIDMHRSVLTRVRDHTGVIALDTAPCLLAEPERQPVGRNVPAGWLARVGARDRLEGALRSIAVDLMGPNEADQLPPACSEMTRAAVARICDTALDALVQDLDALLAGLPPDVVRQLGRARLRLEAGFA
jgi:hypothetical protein